MLALPAVFSVDAVLAVVGVVLMTCLTARIDLGQRGAKPAPFLNQKVFHAAFHDISPCMTTLSPSAPPTEARERKFFI